MNKSKRLISILLLSILLSSAVGWFSDPAKSLVNSKDMTQNQWQLPEQKSINLTKVNQQLTNLKIWGKNSQQKNSKAVIEKWQLVGITRIGGIPKALIEISGELSLKRVSLGEEIMAGVSLLSISEESIIVTIDGEQSEVSLYQ